MERALNVVRQRIYHAVLLHIPELTVQWTTNFKAFWQWLMKRVGDDALVAGQ